MTMLVISVGERLILTLESVHGMQPQTNTPRMGVISYD